MPARLIGCWSSSARFWTSPSALPRSKTRRAEQAIRNYETGGTVKDKIARLLDRRELYGILHQAENAR